MLDLRWRGGDGVASLCHLRRRGHGKDGAGESARADGKHADVSDVWGTWQDRSSRVRELSGKWPGFGDGNTGDPGADRHRGWDEDTNTGGGARWGEGRSTR